MEGLALLPASGRLVVSSVVVKVRDELRLTLRWSERRTAVCLHFR
jgi:hypothetical protein